MRRILQNGTSFLALPSEDILSAGFIIMGLSALSGILGLVRLKLLSSLFTPDLVGIYLVSFVIPENVFQILVVGALGSAFIPVFSKYKSEENKWDFALSFLHLSLGIFILFVIFAAIFTEPLSLALVPGLVKENPTHLALLVNLTRIILISQLFFVISYFFTGILQSFRQFVIPALTPVFYNVGIVIGIVFFAPQFGMYGVAIGIILGALLHLFIQVPFVQKLGFKYRIHMDLSHKGIWEIVHLMTPRTVSLLLERLKLTVDTMLASLISLSSITFLNFALSVAVFPVSLFAAALAQAAFPFLSKAAANNNFTEFKNHISLSLTHIVFFLAPVSILLMTLHTPVVRIIFGSRLFSWDATFLTSWTLVFLASGLIFQGAGILLARGFYALYDTKTPLVITFFSLFVAVILSLIFVLILHLPIWSLAISSSVGGLINALALFIALDRRIGGFNHFSLFLSLSKIILISIFLSIFTYFEFKFLENFFDTNYTVSLIVFTTIVGLLAVCFYIFLSFVFNLEEFKALVSLLQKIKNAPKIWGKEMIVNESKLNP